MRVMAIWVVFVVLGGAGSAGLFVPQQDPIFTDSLSRLSLDADVRYLRSVRADHFEFIVCDLLSIADCPAAMAFTTSVLSNRQSTRLCLTPCPTTYLFNPSEMNFIEVSGLAAGHVSAGGYVMPIGAILGKTGQ